MTAGEEFAKKMRPWGMALFLVFGVMVTLVCLTAGHTSIPDYTAPRASEYYEEHLDELVTELQTNVMPKLPGIVSCERSYEGDTVEVVISPKEFINCRSAILDHYDQDLFIFRKDGQ